MTEDYTAELSKKSIAAKAELARKGLRVTLKPKWSLPRLPLQLTELDDEDLMDLLTKLTRYEDYASVHLAEAEINENEAASRLEVEKARFITAGWTGASGDRVTVLKAECATDKKVMEADDQHRFLKGKRKLYNVMVDSLGRDASVVSRELSRRIGRNSRENRTDKYS